MSESLELGGTRVAAGSRARIELPVARLFTGGWLSLPVVVLHGRRPGPRLWVNAALHGDELNGMEIILEVLERLDPGKLVGALIAVPVVNVFGFIHQTRYLPDRRDLNRSFPGSPRGSLASRLAHLFLTEVVDRCRYGIDLHTGSLHRSNLPHVRGPLDDPETRRIAEAFGAPLMFPAPTISGSLRAVAGKRGAHLIVFEAGEPLRFNRPAIDLGVRGVLRVMRALEMWEEEDPGEPPATIEARTARWVRAAQSGIFRSGVALGQQVAARQVLGQVTDAFSSRRRAVRAPEAGVVIGLTNNPLVYQGDALVHLAH